MVLKWMKRTVWKPRGDQLMGTALGHVTYPFTVKPHPAPVT